MYSESDALCEHPYVLTYTDWLPGGRGVDPTPSGATDDASVVTPSERGWPPAPGAAARARRRTPREGRSNWLGAPLPISSRSPTNVMPRRKLPLRRSGKTKRGWGLTRPLRARRPAARRVYGVGFVWGLGPALPHSALPRKKQAGTTRVHHHRHRAPSFLKTWSVGGEEAHALLVLRVISPSAARTWRSASATRRRCKGPSFRVSRGCLLRYRRGSGAWRRAPTPRSEIRSESEFELRDNSQLPTTNCYLGRTSK
eukprot:scaffold9928_cov112-Isochrysis_galbana.AAC.1